MKRLPPVERWPRWARPLGRTSGPLPRPSVLNWAFDTLLAAVVLVMVMIYALEGNIDGRHGPIDPYEPAGQAPYEPSGPDGPEGPLPPEPFEPPEPGDPFASWPPHFDPAPAGDFGIFVAAVLTLLASLPLVLRRRYPLAVLWVVIVAAALTPETAPRLTFYACVIAAYSAAAYSPYRLATILSMPVMFLAAGSLTGSTLPTVPSEYVPILVLVPITVAANGLRTWKQRTQDGNARVVALERERGEAVRRATEHERSRIARELHDVVTHNVSMMVIQAGAARKVMDASPDQAREALLAVEAGGRAAMTELRHVMGLLTTDSDPDGELSPQPGLGRLGELVDGVRDTGVSVSVTVDGEARELPSGVDLAAYRVVQEALTNSVKHSGGAPIRVSVSYRPAEIAVEITDTGGTPSEAAATGNGRGLIGLRERLTLYGGTLETGPLPSGGYRVAARIPLESL
ncbi:histidine kinase [Phytomonospora sp. NPDC050363]|uniref:sensor histidine kinase n=1 Tax=Phytomonospora sp. NPDC050363 TaxID=3155642 RepID=UPI0033F411C0